MGSGIGQLFIESSVSDRRCTAGWRMSTQYTACSRSDHNGPSPSLQRWFERTVKREFTDGAWRSVTVPRRPELLCQPLVAGRAFEHRTGIELADGEPLDFLPR